MFASKKRVASRALPRGSAFENHEPQHGLRTVICWEGLLQLGCSNLGCRAGQGCGREHRWRDGPGCGLIAMEQVEEDGKEREYGK